MDFKLFLENVEQAVRIALQARQQAGCKKARFGDCKDVASRTALMLKKAGINARLVGGLFYTSQDEHWEHSWVMVGDEVLDPTVDQFFSSLDVDLHTHTPGIYYSAIDGDWLKSRYKHSKP